MACAMALAWHSGRSADLRLSKILRESDHLKDNNNSGAEYSGRSEKDGLLAG
jgi:hypothetical protein